MRHARLCSLLAAALLAAGCAASTGSRTNLQSMPLNDTELMSEGARKLHSWQAFFTTEERLIKSCIKEPKGAERAAQLEACYAAPLRADAQKVGLAPMAALTTYLTQLQVIANRAATGQLTEDAFLRDYAVAKDVFLTALNRHLQASYGLFDAQRTAFIKDNDVIALKGEALMALYRNSGMPRFFAKYEIFRTAQLLAAADNAKVNLPADARARLAFTPQDGKLMAKTYLDYVYAFYTLDDIETLNRRFSQEALSAEKEELILLGITSAQEDLMKRKLLDGLAAIFGRLSEKVQEDSSPADLKAIENKVKEMAR
jgi:hypothetical protein